jgi:hypothetical protein
MGMEGDCWWWIGGVGVGNNGSLIDVCASVNVPHWDVEFLENSVARRSYVEIDEVDSLLLDIEKAERVGVLLPKRAFTERAI